MTRPSSAAGERDDATRLAAFHDRFGDRSVVVDADTGDVIEHLKVVPVLAAQERAIRERVDRLNNFRHVRFPRLRGVESSGTGSDRSVVVLADHVPGHRLSALLAFVDRHPTLTVDVNAALQVVREVLPALAVLHDSRGVTHGTVGLERMVLTAQGRVVLVDYFLGLAVERLQYPRSRLWKDFRLAMPPTAGVPRLDQRADVAQVALVLLALLLGRPVAFGEFPEGLRPLLQSAVERLPDGTVRPLSAPLKTWLERALPLESRKPFTTALDAQVAFEDLIKKARGYSPSAASLKAFLNRYEVCLAKDTAPPGPKAQEMPARGSAARAKAPATSAVPPRSEPLGPEASGSHAARRPAARPLSPEEEAADEIRSLEAELARLARTGDERSDEGDTSRPLFPTVHRLADAASRRAGTATGQPANDDSTGTGAVHDPARHTAAAHEGSSEPDRSRVVSPGDTDAPVQPAARAELQVGGAERQAATVPPSGRTVATHAAHPVTLARTSPGTTRARAVEAVAAASAETPDAGPRECLPQPESGAACVGPAGGDAVQAAPAGVDGVADAAGAVDRHPASPATRHAGSEAVQVLDIAAGSDAAAMTPSGEPETEVLVLGPPLPAIEIISKPDGTETRLVVTDDGTPVLGGLTDVPPGRADEEDEVAYLERVLRELAIEESAQSARATDPTGAARPSAGDAQVEAEAGSAVGRSSVQPTVQSSDVPSGTVEREGPGVWADAGVDEAPAPRQLSQAAATAATEPGVLSQIEPEAEAWRLEPPPADAADGARPDGAEAEAEGEPVVVDEWSLWLDFDREPEFLAVVRAPEPYHRRLRRRHGRPRLSRADVTRLQMLTAIHGREEGAGRRAAPSPTSKSRPAGLCGTARRPAGGPSSRALPAEAMPVSAAMAVRRPSGVLEIAAQAAPEKRAPAEAALVLVAPGAAAAKRNKTGVRTALPARCGQEAAPLARREVRGLVAALAEVGVEAVPEPAVLRFVPGLAVETLCRELRGSGAPVVPTVVEAADPGDGAGVFEGAQTTRVTPEEVDGAEATVASALARDVAPAGEHGGLPIDACALPRLEDLAPTEPATTGAIDDTDAAVLPGESSAEEELRRLLAALSAEVGAPPEASDLSTSSGTLPGDAEASLAAWALDAADSFDLGGLADVGGTSGWLSEALLGTEARAEVPSLDLTGDSASSGPTDAPIFVGPLSAPAEAAPRVEAQTPALPSQNAPGEPASGVQPPDGAGSASPAVAESTLAAPAQAVEGSAPERRFAGAIPAASLDEGDAFDEGPIPSAAAAAQRLPAPASEVEGPPSMSAAARAVAEPVATEPVASAIDRADAALTDAAALEWRRAHDMGTELSQVEATVATSSAARPGLDEAARAAPDQAEPTREGAALAEAASQGAPVAPSLAGVRSTGPPGPGTDAGAPAPTLDEGTRAIGTSTADMPPARLARTLEASPGATASGEVEAGNREGHGAASAPTANRAVESQAVPAPVRHGADERPAGVVRPAVRDVRLVSATDAAAAARPVEEPSRGPTHDGTSPAAAAIPPAAAAVGAEETERTEPAGEQRSFRPLPAQPGGESAPGQLQRGTRTTEPATKSAKRRPRRARGGVVPSGRPVPTARSAPPPGQPVGPATTRSHRSAAVEAAVVRAAQPIEPPHGPTAPSGSSLQLVSLTPPGSSGSVPGRAAARSASDPPLPTEPRLDGRDESRPDLSLVYAPWRLTGPAPDAAARPREAGYDAAGVVDPWNRAPETARIKAAPPEVPQAASVQPEPAGVAPIAAVPAAGPEAGSSPAPAVAGPDQPDAELDTTPSPGREPVLFAHWEERPPAASTSRRWRIDWKRTAAAALVVVLLEGVAFATAYWLVRPPESGTLLVQTSEAGVDVWIDGRPRGRTPLSVELAPGRHTLEMRGHGATKTMPVEISPGVQTTQFVRWRRAVRTGTLKVKTTPEGARILVDGRYRGVSPLVIENVPVGPHTIVAEHPSGTVKSAVDVVAEATAEADIGIFSGWLAVYAPIEVRVFLGGRLLGTSLDGKLLVPPGHHEIEVINTRLGYRETRSIDIEPGRTTAVSIEAPNGTIAIEAPDGTEVSVDGKVVGVMPLEPVTAPIGTREVILRHPHLGQRRITVSVGLDAPARVSLLAPQ